MVFRGRGMNRTNAQVRGTVCKPYLTSPQMPQQRDPRRTAIALAPLSLCFLAFRKSLSLRVKPLASPGHASTPFSAHSLQERKQLRKRSSGSAGSEKDVC